MKYIKIFLKLIGIGCFAVIILFLIFIIIIVGIDSYNEGVASNPDRIISKVDMTFPSYKVKNSYDNMERMSSCWNSYEYTIQFKEPLTKYFLEELESKLSDSESCWIKLDSITYKFQKEEISIVLYIRESTMNVEYMWESWF